MNGIPITLYDTAGIRETRDVIENEGVRRAIDKAHDVDIKILLIDSSTPQLDKKIIDLVDNETIIY